MLVSHGGVEDNYSYYNVIRCRNNTLLSSLHVYTILQLDMQFMPNQLANKNVYKANYKVLVD